MIADCTCKGHRDTETQRIVQTLRRAVAIMPLVVVVGISPAAAQTCSSQKLAVQILGSAGIAVVNRNAQRTPQFVAFARDADVVVMHFAILTNARGAITQESRDTWSYRRCCSSREGAEADPQSRDQAISRAIRTGQFTLHTIKRL
jgi:hypothetical protein